MPGQTGVVCVGERTEHDGEKDHAIVMQHCFWKILLVYKIAGGGSYFQWVYRALPHAA